MNFFRFFAVVLAIIMNFMALFFLYFFSLQNTYPTVCLADRSYHSLCKIIFLHILCKCTSRLHFCTFCFAGVKSLLGILLFSNKYVFLPPKPSLQFSGIFLMARTRKIKAILKVGTLHAY
jgi:hypothetical protein